jgi:hypothetical protein
MAQISEAGNQSQISGALRDGLAALDLGQTVTFQQYSRTVLPLDGYVFWSPTVQLTANGSLHYAQDQVQDETETYGMAAVTFTSEIPVAEFGQVGTNAIFVGSLGGFRYAFSQQQGFYSQAGLWHYFGHSIAPAMASQLLDSPGVIDTAQPVVSNSLPLWLALNNYTPTYGVGGGAFSNPLTPTNYNILYPAFLSAPDIVPPYGTVHIESTRALQSVPYLDANRSHVQLVADRVRVTLYGLQNNAALDFLDCVMQYTTDTENFGLMNTPVVSDGHRHQVELGALAMQKVIDFEVSYYQVRAAQVARQLILSAVPTFVFGA